MNSRKRLTCSSTACRRWAKLVHMLQVAVIGLNAREPKMGRRSNSTGESDSVLRCGHASPVLADIDIDEHGEFLAGLRCCAVEDGDMIRVVGDDHEPVDIAVQRGKTIGQRRGARRRRNEDARNAGAPENFRLAQRGAGKTDRARRNLPPRDRDRLVRFGVRPAASSRTSGRAPALHGRLRSNASRSTSSAGVPAARVRSRAPVRCSLKPRSSGPDASAR